MRRLSPLFTVVALSVAGLIPGVAQADVFGPISLASASAIPGFPGNQQADYAHDAAISGDGRYVAFDGSYGGFTGVWRRDLRTGVVEAVAAENPAEPAVSAPDADLPSISEDGRYVSFTTTARLDPADDVNPGPDVYVRDMEIAASQPCEPGPGSAQPCAFTLASAADGSTAGLTYEPTGKFSSVPFEEQHYGSVAAGRSALSADGRRVVFVTTVISNLVGAGTPALQVVTRDLDSEHTELISVADDPATGQPLVDQPVFGEEGGEPYGAVYTGLAGKPPIFVDPPPYEAPAPIGASISADGSTVAWMGIDVGKQARMLPGESQRVAYVEPLWRRIADGQAAPIRRITGGSDPSDPSCVASGEAALPGTASLSDPCQGPFASTQDGRLGVFLGGAGDVIPRLSADGYSVVFLANAPLVSLGEDFGVSEPKSDLYLVDMHEGLSRTGALRPLTALAGGDQQDIAENAPIKDLGISADGHYVAFATQRTQFPLGSPAYISAPAAAPGMLELFDVDLLTDTLTRVTNGFEGGPSEHPHEATASGVDPYTRGGDGALSPSFSNGGSVVAFSATASNLAFGDGNTPPLNADKFDGSDAFIVPRVIFNPTPTQQSISAPPAGPSIAPAWRLGVTARSRADGSVLLYVSVPGAGALHAGAKSAVRVRARRRGRMHTSVATRSVATAKKAVRAGGGVVTLALTLAPRYKAFAAKRPGLSGAASITFTASGHPAVRQIVSVSFLRTAKPKTKPKSKAHSSRRFAAARGGRSR